MVKFTTEDIQAIMGKPANIRNMSVIAHVDHGKSTLTDSLLAKAGLISQKDAGLKRETDTMAEEAERGITIKSTGVSLHYELTGEHDKVPGMEHVHEETKNSPAGKKFLINLIDSPGHVDFSSEVTAALRITDGALVVVDCIEGVCVQTETVLRQALQERVKPVLMLNKMDRVMLELKMEKEECYKTFEKIVENVNVVVSTYEDDKLGDVQVDPTKGTVGFGSGYQGWGFTLYDFARFYAKKLGADPNKLVKKLWGDNFFDAKTKKWTKKETSEDGRPLERGFCKFVLDPIFKLYDYTMNEDKEARNKILGVLDVPVEKEIDDLLPKQQIRQLMQKFLPLADALLQVIVIHLPSPATAQKYRVENLYSGPMDDEAANAIRKCDPEGPLMMYVSKMVPTSDKRFFAFGRVFSGTARSGQKVTILGPNYEHGGKKDKYTKNIQKTVLMMAGKIQSVDSCPCGNTVGLIGLDAFLVKTGTITTLPEAHIFHDMKFSVSPVVRVAIECVNGKDLPKLVEGMKSLSKSDPCVLCRQEETGELVIAGAGELHLEICLNQLRDEYAKGIAFRTSNPVVSFCETITAESSQTVIAKSPNKHNRLYFTAEPLDPELVQAIEDGDIEVKSPGEKELVAKLTKEFGWDQTDCKKTWFFGPELNNTNCIVDATKGVQYLLEIKDHVKAAFNSAGYSGPICGEPMRGIRFNIEDVVLHADAIHRGGGQILPTANRVMCAAVLCAEPRLMEPVFLVDIQAPQSCMGGIYNVMNKRRGQVIEEVARPGTTQVQVKAYLPVLESFGFNGDLRGATKGMAFPQCRFDHWEVIQSSPLDEGSQAHTIMMDVRKRKGMKMEIPQLANFMDKL
eukprot:TRINITY_DN1217_c0_g1_i1.p1 TRINITY_DN1217_c0_g1~~TRINITY_DN1217_c0_g1_i1.p1  ORF type:complete len:853 (-),score=324.57 TRINITY_DN1217_c0_g1_i1:324-2882(-)